MLGVGTRSLPAHVIKSARCWSVIIKSTLGLSPFDPGIEDSAGAELRPIKAEAAPTPAVCRKSLLLIWILSLIS
jgi:hypothetical protein